MLRVLLALVPVRDVTDYFCLVPTYEGNRISEWGYMVSSSQLEKMANGEDPSWVTFAAQDLPIKALEALPTLPIRVPDKLAIRLRILSLCATIDWMQRLAVELDTIPLPGSRYDQALREKWLRYLDCRCAEVADLIHDIREHPGAVDLYEPEPYKRFGGMLDGILTDMRKQELRNIRLPDSEEIEDMVDGLFG